MPEALLYQSRQAQGLCPECGTRPPFPGRTRCLACLQTNAAWYAVYGSPAAKARYQASDPWGLSLGDGQRLLCCEGWRTIDAVPFTAPCCGRRWFVEVPAADA